MRLGCMGLGCAGAGRGGRSVAFIRQTNWLCPFRPTAQSRTGATSLRCGCQLLSVVNTRQLRCHQRMFFDNSIARCGLTCVQRGGHAPMSYVDLTAHAHCVWCRSGTTRGSSGCSGMRGVRGSLRTHRPTRSTSRIWASASTQPTSAASTRCVNEDDAERLQNPPLPLATPRLVNPSTPASFWE